MLEILFGVLALFILAGVIWLRLKLMAVLHQQAELPDALDRLLTERHRDMLTDMHGGLEKLGDRLSGTQAESAERLREAVSRDLSQTRDAMQALAVGQAQGLADGREAVGRQLAELSAQIQSKQDSLRAEILAKTLQTLADQGRADQELIQTTMRNATEALTKSVGVLTTRVDERLGEISGKVHERLEEGFRKTNETFVNVMSRLATIDEAQKKIDGLTSNVISLQDLLSDKRSRGAFGEVQLSALVANILPAGTYTLQATLSNRARVDCLLELPEPTGRVAIDSKFPLENYQRMFAAPAGSVERLAAERQFKADVRKHVDDISAKYILPGETADGAVMFVPAEAVFAEIHAYHGDLVEHALKRRVWIVSPTTLMAVLNTARAVLKDVETRRQVHVIKDELFKLGKDFSRFDERMKKLADHIRQANQDAEQIAVSSQKITRRFLDIESVEIAGADVRALTDTAQEVP